ncbi:helix-hairpin-helix domain-containing protein [Paenibacillus sp. 7124]|uniref:Helix-hairpin-helix domain-containing protein n=1 Tax=Paenibacillus apii TaxID=1850370 RepID=A0A6M1PNJ8_9BACL|nr:helix-hairpin-helix domain-containing protein [Paenibacillus apii]NGM81881.1 helix-hairpin-helix domain-containing protein [Paenibacillus apii]
MKKTMLIGRIAAAIIGSGLIWMAGSGRDQGTEGWEMLNARVAQAIEGGQDASASIGRDGGQAATGRSGAAGEVGGSPWAGEAVTATAPVLAAQSGTGGSLPGHDAAPAAGAADAQTSAEGKVNVNTAGLTELTSLPGIGEKKAQAILDYRKQHGPFRSPTDLQNVKGIGPKMLEKLKPYVAF